MSHDVNAKCVGCGGFFYSQEPFGDVRCECGTMNFANKAIQRYRAATKEAPVTVPAQATPGNAGGMKFDAGKPRWSLLMGGMPGALTGVAEVLTFGAKKYAAHSWKTVPDNRERYRDALYRHLNALESGELADPESGLSHWDHICCNALFLSQLAKDADK